MPTRGLLEWMPCRCSAGTSQALESVMWAFACFVSRASASRLVAAGAARRLKEKEKGRKRGRQGRGTPLTQHVASAILHPPLVGDVAGETKVGDEGIIDGVTRGVEAGEEDEAAAVAVSMDRLGRLGQPGGEPGERKGLGRDKVQVEPESCAVCRWQWPSAAASQTRAGAPFTLVGLDGRLDLLVVPGGQQRGVGVGAEVVARPGERPRERPRVRVRELGQRGPAAVGGQGRGHGNGFRRGGLWRLRESPPREAGPSLSPAISTMMLSCGSRSCNVSLHLKVRTGMHQTIDLKQRAAYDVPTVTATSRRLQHRPLRFDAAGVGSGCDSRA